MSCTVNRASERNDMLKIHIFFARDGSYCQIKLVQSAAIAIGASLTAAVSMLWPSGIQGFFFFPLKLHKDVWEGV